MSFIKTAIKRPVTVLMVALCVLVLGFTSFSKMPMELTPDFNLPMAIVSTTYSGAGPSEVESLVTRPLEKVLGTTPGLQNIISQSSEGSSLIMLELEFGTDMDNASMEIREKLDLVKAMLPDTASSPMLLQFNMNDMPVVTLSASGDSADLLYQINESIVPELEKIAGVASVDVSGGSTSQVRVDLDQARLRQYGLNINSIISTISASSVNLPAGSISLDDKSVFLRGQYEYNTIGELKSLPITLPTGNVIHLSDVADIYQYEKESDSISRINGQNNITISVSKQQSANTVTVAKNLRQEMKTLDALYPDIHLSMVLDQGEAIQSAINSVISSLLLGGALAILVLWLFLGDFKASMIIGTSIPFSVVITFVLMYFMGIDLNLISLGGLVVGVGMMVDNSIVVLESIFRCRSQKMDVKQAAFEGAKIVGSAIVASTLTTVVVFLPIVFIKGLTSEIFGQAALTIAFSLLASLISALTIVPCMFAKLSPEEKTGTKFAKAFGRLEDFYSKVIGWALHHKKSVVAISVAFFVGSLFLTSFIGSELMPAIDQGQFSVSIETEQGLKKEEKDQYVQAVEQVLSGIPEIETYSSSVGSSSSNTSSVTVFLYDDAKRTTSQVVAEVRSAVSGMPGCSIKVTETSSMMMSAGSSGSSVSLTIMGNDQDDLKTATADIEAMMAKINGVVATSSSVSVGRPEARVVVNATKAAAYGFTPATVISSVNTMINGRTAATLKGDEQDMDIVVSFPEGSFETVSDLQSMTLTSPAGLNVPLTSIADIVFDNGPITVNRQNNQYVYTASAQVAGRDFGSVYADIQKGLNNMILPYGVDASFSGMAQMQTETFSDMFLVLFMAIILVFMVMAAQFESMRFSIVVMVSVPFSISGALLGLFLTGCTLNMTSIIGMIVLVGVVVNNAIVLIDYVGQMREKGMNVFDALTYAGKTRLRPIFMTTITTVLGMVPLALGIGEGGQMLQSMAVVVIFGLICSTLLTLIVIPVFYSMSENGRQKKLEKKARRLQEKEIKKALKAAEYTASLES